MAAVLQEIETAARGVLAGMARSVVGVRTRWGAGSGVVLEAGKVLTNAHNLRGEKAEVVFDDGRAVEATLLGVDLDGDLAVLAADTGDLPAVTWPDADGVALASAVFAIANPGGRGLRVTFGLVSGIQRPFRGPRGRRIAGAVEHTAPLLPGSSGGPVVDTTGRLLGINTHRIGEGFYLAIAADDALRLRVEELAHGESHDRPRLGVAVAPAGVARKLRRAVGLPDADGLLVRGVEEGSLAHRAGIQEGDLITAAAGRAIEDVDDLHAALDALAAGGTLEIVLLRGAEERTVTVGG